MTKVIAIGAALIGIVGVAAILWLRSGPDPSQFAYLATPRVTHMDNQRMLVVEAVGDPSLVAGRAFKLLFTAYYKTGGVSRTHRPPAPRARWRLSLDIPRTEWVGRYALPVAREVTTAPSVQVETGWHLDLETWEYGDIAEVLHVGPYSDEQADIGRLQAFIGASGRRVVGEHEEDCAIIRLRVAAAKAD